MQMKAKLFFLFLTLVISVGNSLADNIIENVLIGDVYYTLGDYSDIGKVASVIKNSGYSGDIVIPKYVTYEGNNYRVRSIDDRVFMNCKNLVSITIPSSVTNIHSYTFYGCENLQSADIGDSITYIDEYAFYGCSNLDSIKIPSGVTGLRKDKYKTDYCSVFANCTNLKTVTINSRYILGTDYTSAYNISKLFGKQVENYIVGGNIDKIGNFTFYKCENLNKLNIPNSIVSIGFDCFPKLSELKNLQFNEYGNACYIGNEENPYLSKGETCR